MSKTRFTAYICSIVGHQIMISPNDSNEQYKCALDDFESILPNDNHDNNSYTFHVKRDRIGVEHYRRWLGMEAIENNRLENMEKALLGIIEMIPAQKPYPEATAASEPEFAQYFTDKAV